MLVEIKLLFNNFFFQCPINVVFGLSAGYERCRNGGIVWQMLCDMTAGRKKKVGTVIATGGRYDGMLAEFQ